MPTPPLPVEVVPGVLGVVAGGGVVVVGAGVVLDGVLGVVEVEVEVVLAVVGVEVEVEVAVDGVEVEGVLVEWTGHRCWVSARTVEAPWATAFPSSGSTPERLLAEFCSCPAAPSAATQLRAARAAETEFSWALSVLPWSADSRLPLLPQAASNDTATPDKPARSARGT
jgi:hypothetical protein